MAETIVELLTDVADAIRKKKGSNEPINAQNFAYEIQNLLSGSAPRWTGHADVEGLRDIGWDDDDIAYYQQYGVNWNEEDDHLHLVSDDNKALYEILTEKNIANYKSRIVYLPKIQYSSNSKSMASKFAQCSWLVAIPMIDTSNITDFTGMFNGCRSLTCVPKLDTSKAISLRMMFYGCWSLQHVPHFDTSNATAMYGFLSGCYFIQEIPHFNTSKVTIFGEAFNGTSIRSIPLLDTSNVTDMSSMFNGCKWLTTIPPFNTSNVTNTGSMFRDCLSLSTLPYFDTSNVTNGDLMIYNCPNLLCTEEIDVSQMTLFNMGYSNFNTRTVKIKGLHISINLNQASFLDVESIKFILDNCQQADEAYTLTLHATAKQNFLNKCTEGHQDYDAEYAASLASATEKGLTLA